MVKVREYPNAKMIFVAFSIALILFTSFLAHAFTYREPIQYEEVSFTAEVGKVFDRYYKSIEDGYEIGFILPESTSNISFTLLLSDNPYDEDDLSNYEIMLELSFTYQEYRGNTRISLKSNVRYISVYISLYISEIGNENNGTVFNVQYFEQRGTFSSRTVSFGLSLFLIIMFWIIIYGSLRGDIKQILRDNKRATLIKRGKLRVGPGSLNKTEKAIDFVFGKRKDEDQLYPGFPGDED